MEEAWPVEFFEQRVIVVSGSSSNSESLSSVYKDAAKARAAKAIMLLSYDTELPHPPA